MTKARPHDQATLLARVWKAQKAAVPVWLALTWVAEQKGRNRFVIKRRTLARLSGIERLPSVSEVLAALERLGIVQREVRRCRRPDGTLFPRLHIRLLHRLTESVSGDRVRKAGSAPGTAPAKEKRIHSPGTPANENRYPSPKGDDGACGVRKTPQRTHVGPAAAAGARRAATAPRPRPAGATCPATHDDGLAPQVRTSLKQLTEQIGCAADDFDIAGGKAILAAAGLLLVVDTHGEIRFAANPQASLQPWSASAEQVQLVRRAVALAKERRPVFWSSVITDHQVELAREIALGVGCRLADFEPLGPFLVLGDGHPVCSTGLVRIDAKGAMHFIKTLDGRRAEEPWQATAEQVECMRQVLRRRQGQ
jgi:hypothetical protein